MKIKLLSFMVLACVPAALAVDANTPKNIYYVGAKYPSALHAPVKFPYYVNHWLDSHMTQFTRAEETVVGGGWRSYYTNLHSGTPWWQQWMNAGVLANEIRNIHTSHPRFVGPTLYDEMAAPAIAGFPGVDLNEFLDNNNNPPLLKPDEKDAVAAGKQLQNEYPYYWIAGWVTSAAHKIPAELSSDHWSMDIMLVEAYTWGNTQPNNIDTYATSVNSFGLAKKAIFDIMPVHHNLNPDGSVKNVWTLTQSEINSEIAKIRNLVPDSPGVGFFNNKPPTETSTTTNTRKGWLNTAVDTYYWSKSPTVNVNLTNGQNVSGTVTVTATGTKNPSTNKSISQYRFFIDRECVQTGASSSYSWNTSGVSAGSHYVTVHAVDTDHLAAAKQVSVNVTSGGGSSADLIVTDISWSPASPVAGQEVTFSATIKNQGTAATPGSTIHGVRFSVGGSTVAWSDDSTSSLAAGATRVVTANGGPDANATWTMVSGTPQVEAFVDDVDRISEGNETNNTLTETVTAGSGSADLIVTDISWTPANPTTGQEVTFSATIENQGTAATPDSTIHGVRFSVGGSTVAWSDDSTSSLAAGATRVVTANGGPDANATWTMVSGTPQVEAFVDDVDRISEGNETNNTLTETVTAGSADLIVTDVSWTPTSPTTGQEVTFSATIKNQGTAATPGSTIHGVRFSVGGSTVAWSDNSTSSLAAGATRVITANGGPDGNATWTMVSGTSSVEAWVDDVNRIAESDDNNNKLTESITAGTSAIAFRAASSATSGSNWATSLVVNKPTGVVSGDFMLAAISSGPGSTQGAPTGWTLVRNIADGVETSIYRKQAGASEPASYTWTVSGSASYKVCGGITAFTGVNATTPIQVENGAGHTTAASTIHTTPSITTTGSASWLVAIFCDRNGTGSTWTAPTGMTERVDTRATGSTAPSASVYTQGPMAAGSYSKTATASVSSEYATMAIIALQP